MLTIAIVEDDLEYQKQLQKYIEEYGKEHELQYKITVFQNGLNFLEDYKGGCDLIFMDIAMPHMDGMETAAKLRKRGDETCLIFITSMAQYALKGYEVNAFDFLVKPLVYELFCIKFEKALSHIDKKEAYYRRKRGFLWKTYTTLSSSAPAQRVFLPRFMRNAQSSPLLRLRQTLQAAARC